MPKLPDVRYGSSSAPINWREHPDNAPDDDEELAETPADVVALLGFDPKDVE